MFETLRNAWKYQDLRKKLLYTLLIVLLFRLGSAVPVPFLDPTAIGQMFKTINTGGNVLGYLDILTGGAFSQATVFALSITPFINSSIIMQLLTVAIPALGRMQKEGEEGRKRIEKITRYVTMGIALLLSTGFYFTLRNQYNAVLYTNTNIWTQIFVAAVIVMSFTAGSALIVWLGERINEKGIGNGISIILFAGIVSRGPAAIGGLYNMLKIGGLYYLWVPLIVVLFFMTVAFIIVMNNAERRIPIQYAKRVVGRKMYGGQSTHIPIKVAMSGVMPIIFASSFVSLPGIILSFLNLQEGTTWYRILSVFKVNSWLYAVVYFVLIIAFNYFYVAIQYDPIEIANNLRKNNGTVPGIRPGKTTSDFIRRILNRITFVGAVFLGIIAVLPIVLGAITKSSIGLGGTTILILVGVALETVRQTESQMMMRHYKGFLE